MRTWVALLRAVNVGGRNLVSMAALRDELTARGFADVRTYVQSGNVVVRSGHPTAAAVAAEVRAAIADAFGLDVAVVVRVPEDLGALLAWNPFPDAVDADPRTVHAVFLAAAPDPARARELAAADLSPERVVVCGSQAVVHYPNGAGRSRLTVDVLERRLGVEGTGRNWRTVAQLAALAAG